MSNPCEDEAPNLLDGSEDVSKKDGEDELETVAVIATTMEGAHLQDPAILMVGPTHPKPEKYTYTKDVLLKLRMSPFSSRRPDYLDVAHDNNGTWDPERWHTERKASESSENGSRNTNGSNGSDVESHRRRSGDPKDRLRREHDGIVLSPQRRSFNSGCFVPVRETTRNTRSHSPLGGKGGDPPGHLGHREISQGAPTRRIGSGRILPWDYPEKNDVDNDFGYRRERDERFDRRSFGRDDAAGSRSSKGSKDGGPFGRNNNRYDRRRASENKEEEPEWFSEGPISQHDTIELRGFDDNEKIGGKKKTGAQKKKAKDKERSSNKTTETLQKPESVDETVDINHKPEKNLNINLIKECDKSLGSLGGEAPNEKEFNLDDFLQNDIPSILRNGIENQSSGGSKFSQWFKRDSPVKNTEQNRRSNDVSSTEDEHHLIKTILNDITESTVNIPGDSESYFAPISPAASTGSTNATHGMQSQAFMEMLHRGKQQHQSTGGGQGNIKNIDMPGKVLILEELEAKMRKGDIGLAGDMRAAHQNVTSDSDENAAFKKLLAQVNAGNLIPASNGPVKAPPAMSLMEMLSHSQKQDEAARMVQIMNAVSGHVPNDLSFKLQQQQPQSQQAQRQQMDALTKLMNSQMRQPARTTPPLTDINMQVRDLLNRPEAQAIFQGLKCGDITPQNLYQQLANPAMQSRHRELLQTILKVLATAPGPSPRVLSPMPPQHPAAYQQQQQQQQLRVSPLPPNALHQRIPSPRELQLHTQHIMHNALIKKKLEEQTENFRKKQESQQQRTPGGGRGISPAKNVASPTQLAWGTPTSVLRKMTADKDDGKDGNKNDQKVQQGRAVTGMRSQPTTQQSQVQQQWNAQYQQQINKQGRAIVKNNANYQVSHQQHEQFLLQQRIFNQQQQRKQTQQFGNMQFAGLPQQFSQSTQFNQHQLRAQHQARVQHQHQQQPQQQQQQQQQQYGQHQPGNWMMQNQNFDNRQQVTGRSGTNDGEMSPTSNQLARWFSSELLDRARKGKLPNMPPPNLAQHAMSLEEIERQATPAHN